MHGQNGTNELKHDSRGTLGSGTGQGRAGVRGPGQGKGKGKGEHMGSPQPGPPRPVHLNEGLPQGKSGKMEVSLNGSQAKRRSAQLRDSPLRAKIKYLCIPKADAVSEQAPVSEVPCGTIV